MSITADWRWAFPAKLVRVIDGDTMYLSFDLGFHVSVVHSIRLMGINAPELREEAGKLARDYASRWFAEHVHVSDEYPFVVETDKDRQSFNRYIGSVMCAEGHGLLAALVEAGHGVAAGR